MKAAPTDCARRLLLAALPALCAGCQSTSSARTRQPPATAALPPAAVRFTDITQQAGIRFRHENAKTPVKYMLETMGSGGGFIDYDGDGWHDIVLMNGTAIPGSKVQGRPTLRLYRNNHDLTFTDVTNEAGLAVPGMYAMGCAVGDYDNDGREDLYVTCVLGPSRLFHNLGARFHDVTARAGVDNASRWGASSAWVDYDKDGLLDLFVCNYVKFKSLADHRPCYAGDRKPVYCAPSAYDTVRCTLYRNLGGGRFRDVTMESGIGNSQGKSLGVTVWDCDDDTWPDLFVANDTTAGYLFHNLGNGKFSEIGLEAGVAFDEEGNAHSGMGIDCDDIHNDGQATLVITNFWAEQTSVYRQAGPNEFHNDQSRTTVGPATSEVLGFGIMFLDFDNDGWKDILQVNGHVQDDVQEREPQITHEQQSLLFRNMRNGTFTEVGRASGRPFTDRIVGRGCAWADVDHDGRVDALVTTNGGPALLWRNETQNPGRWLALRLVGARSPRSGIGALVIARSATLRQRTLVRSGSSYLSASALEARFGLGPDEKADLEVRWPSGTVDRVPGVRAGRIWTLREGSGVVK